MNIDNLMGPSLKAALLKEKAPKKKKRKKKSRAKMPLTAAQRSVLKLMKRTGAVAYAYLRENGEKCYRIRNQAGEPLRNVQERVISGLKSKGYLVHLKRGGLRPFIKRAKKAIPKEVPAPATDLKTFVETECKQCHETGNFKNNCNTCPGLKKHLVQPEKIS